MIQKCLLLGLACWAIAGASGAAEDYVSSVPFIATADVHSGELQFQVCRACHTLEQGAAHGVGPNLDGLLDRDAGAAAGFAYSEAIGGVREPWTLEKLDRFVHNPMAYAPGTRMVYPGIRNPQQRASVLSYLLNKLGKRDLAVAASSSDADAPATVAEDPFGEDWPQGPGRDLTGFTCNACHSLAIVKQQGLTHKGWNDLIDWMIEEQGMADPEAERRTEMVQYLGDHFGINR